MSAGTRLSGTLTDIAREYGTPAYVYRLDAVRTAAAALRAALPPAVRAYYSVKANPHPLLAAALVSAGFDLEISSIGELAVAATTGTTGRSLYTGPGKTEEELVAALRAGVRLFSVESRTEHDRLLRLTDRTEATDVRHLVRLNPAGAQAPAGLRMAGAPSQFGVAVEQLEAGEPMLTAAGRLRFAGFHLYSASNVADGPALLTELSGNAAVVAAVARNTAAVPEVVDIGGGFAAPFAVPGARTAYPDLRAGLAAALDAHLPGWRSGEPAVAVESGRHLVAEAGVLLTTVMDVKTTGGQRYIVCDAGVNALGGMSGLGRLLPPRAQPERHEPGGQEGVLVGPLCTPLDILNRRVELTEPAVGDVLAIPNTGAYGLTAGLVAFLGRPMPVEVVLDGTDVAGARRLMLSETEVGCREFLG
ncbi:alanine racemase [Paractinoplanes ferrugineus]|uniref:Diaminopimelate decarboxylase n=1 Tax=Paractinoplanes ferrugineus TaxID=113564 RepID=A0A919J3G6_9ACTN|nr:type III PLP-dependent enzyme [Actinoplanes ferrugineus]GIE13253.1 diaminopimelate decarboxylase [Actinoplanes ferrugineus]